MSFEPRLPTSGDYVIIEMTAKFIYSFIRNDTRAAPLHK